MKYLLDISTLLAAIIQNHPNHAVVDAWVQKKKIAVCPLSELGFLRIGTHPNAYNLSMPIARQALRQFIASCRADFIAADLPALRSSAAKSSEVTHAYLAELAAQHHLKLATLDEGLKHSAAELIR